MIIYDFVHHILFQSGGLSSANLHVCRTVARRCERALVGIVERGDCDHVVRRMMMIV